MENGKNKIVNNKTTKRQKLNGSLLGRWQCAKCAIKLYASNAHKQTEHPYIFTYSYIHTYISRPESKNSFDGIEMARFG